MTGRTPGRTPQLKVTLRAAQHSRTQVVSEDSEILAELLFHADRFCREIEYLTPDVVDPADQRELRLKLGQCRNLQVRLQSAFNEDQLDLKRPEIRAEFRQMVIAALWIAFYARRFLDRKVYRMLVNIEAGFSGLLCQR